ncbi:L-threonylcarbamoyladenylate synthase [Fundidesulfovibrio butyratiphilus]
MDFEVSRDPRVARAADLLASGGCVIYPTETFYALGAHVGSASALSRVIAIKGRPQSKPLPCIIGHMSQLDQVISPSADKWEGFETAMALMRAFWPGPLSIVVPGRPSLPSQVMDLQGMVSVRLTPHPQARSLCLLAKGPLSASSANISGEPPASRLRDLSPALTLAADMALPGDPEPAGGLPSTLVLPGPDRGFVVLRQGSLPLKELHDAGFAPAGEIAR